MKKTVIEKILGSFAKKTLANHKPQIIGVTGSVGKSSAKEAIGAVLGKRFHVRTSPKNFNTEIGLPLTVLNVPTGGASAVKWVAVVWKGWMASMSKDPKYPEMLVLEYGMQNRGDIAKLCDIARPDIAVVTTIGESHMEFMGSVDAIEKEKRVLVERLRKDGVAVLNRDDERVWAMRTKTDAKVVSFGYHEGADVRALADSLTYVCSPDQECGMRVKISTGAGTEAGATVPVFIPNVLGKHAIYAALAAAAVGLEKGMNLVEISDALSLYVAPAGRMRYIHGIKHSVIIDDTYNAAPKSVTAALDVLRDLPVGEGNKRIAVLGDMLELGTATEDGHRAVGRKAAECADLIVLVGERMTFAQQAAHEAGAGEDRVFHFGTTEEAGRFVQEKMKMGDFVLVKGSQGMRMERVVKEIMAEPLDAAKLLVRQDAEWSDTP